MSGERAVAGRADRVRRGLTQARNLLSGIEVENRVRSTDTLGMSAAKRWLEARRLEPSDPRWYVEITIHGDRHDISFDINVYPEEWGFVYRASGRTSSIRVTDIPFVHGSDFHDLLSETPELDQLGQLLTRLETKHQFSFQRRTAQVSSNLAGVRAAVRPWLEHLY